MRGRIPGFGPRLKAMREARGLTQAKLAERAGTAADSVVKFEGGAREPTLELAWRLATALGVPVTDLLPAPWHPAIERPAATGEGRQPGGAS